MTNVFLSYARGDDEPFVRRLYDDLTAAGFTVWFDRVSMPSRALTFLQEIRDAVATSDRLLLVVGPKAVASDYVAAEWRCALELCIAVTPVLRLGDYGLVPPELSVHHCPDARPERPYADALAELARVLADPVPPLGALHDVPSLPAHFLPRDVDLAFLRETLLADVQRPTVITSARQTTSLQGMGGVGKSVMAAAFARTCEARRAFGDGVVWVTLGQQPDVLRAITRLAAALGDDTREYVDLPRARGRLPGLLAARNCLLILDDAWDVVHVEPFANALGPRCRLLVTTRDGGLAATLGAQEHRLDVLEEAQALALLAQWAGSPPEQLPREARAVAGECGRLPFALALCGAMARDGAPWADLLDALAEADLAFLRKQFPNYPYPDVLRALKVSVDALAASDPAWAKHYAELAVFPSDEAVPEAAVVQLWVYTNGLNERSARQLLTTLGRKSLLRLEGDAPQRHVTLHDLQHDYLRAALHDLSGLHAELLAAYREKCPEGWHTGPHDGYFFDHLAYHLARASRSDELADTLLDYRWLRARLIASGPAPLIADYDVVERIPHPDPAPAGSSERALPLIQGALRLSAHVVGPDPAQLNWQLTGRLLGFDDELIRGLLAQARRETEGPWLRPLAPELDAPGGPLVRTLTGHTAGVNAVALTPDGRLAVSASYDTTLKVWDVASGRELRTLTGHASWVNALALTPDGRLAVSASGDRTLKVWDVASGRELRTLTGHTGGVNAVALTPDGRLAVSASEDHTLKVWDVASGRELRTLVGHTMWVNCVALTPDGRLAVSASWDHTLKVWDVASGQELGTLTGHTNMVNAVALTPDGRLAVSASDDHTLKVWDVASGRELRTLTGHTRRVQSVALTPDGRMAVSASKDKTLKVWDISAEPALSSVRSTQAEGLNAGVASGRELATLTGHADSVDSVALTPDGRLAVSASWDRTLRVWDISAALNAGVARGRELRTPAGHTDSVKAVALTPDGRLAVSASDDKTLKVWDVASGRELRTLAGHSLEVTAVALTPDGRLAVSASDDHTLKVWDVARGRELRTLAGHRRGVTAVALTPDGRLAVSASLDKTLKVWDLASGRELRTLAGLTEWVNAVALTPDGRLAVSASWDRTLKVWDLVRGRELRTLAVHTSQFLGLALTPDGRMAVSASNRTLNVWDLASGRELGTLTGHTGWVRVVALTPDGRLAVSASDDDTLKVWDISAALNAGVASGRELRTMAGHILPVTAVALTPDGRLAVSVSRDDTLKVWDVASGRELASCTGEGATCCAANGAGGVLLMGDDAGRVHFLHLENVVPGSAVVTAWLGSGSRITRLLGRPVRPAFGCPHCRTWSEVPASALGTELPCPRCGKPVKLNPFVIEADWRPVAAAWRGKP